MAGIFAIPFQSHYSSAKFALEAYARALRMESGAYGIRVCLIEPGDTATGFTAARTFVSPEARPTGKRAAAAWRKWSATNSTAVRPSRPRR